MLSSTLNMQKLNELHIYNKYCFIFYMQVQTFAFLQNVLSQNNKQSFEQN